VKEAKFAGCGRIPIQSPAFLTYLEAVLGKNKLLKAEIVSGVVK
jgi:hypothetical protein